MHPGEHPAARATGAAPRSGAGWLVAGARVLGGTGGGLLVWLSVSSILLPAPGGQLQSLSALRTSALCLALVLAACALPVLLWRRVQAPGWRASALAWCLALLAGGAMLVLQLHPVDGATLPVALATGLCALAAVSLAGHGEDLRAPLRLPTRLAVALLAGATVLFALIALRWPGDGIGAAPAPSLLVLGAVAGALLLGGWRGAGGLRGKRRWAVLALLVLLPWMLALLLRLVPGWAGVVWPLVAASVLAGAWFEQRQAQAAAAADTPLRGGAAQG